MVISRRTGGVSVVDLRAEADADARRGVLKTHIIAAPSSRPQGDAGELDHPTPTCNGSVYSSSDLAGGDARFGVQGVGDNPRVVWTETTRKPEIEKIRENGP